MACLLLGGCVAQPVNELSPSAIDPYEGFNRSMYSFNDDFDNYFTEPVVGVYKFITPNLVQTGVANFFANLNNVGVVFNDILQGKAQQGAEDFGRFLINSTVGVLGIFDVAVAIGLAQNQEDFDQTLAVWGVPSGAYLVMPFFGPTTFRGFPSAVLDVATNPISYAGLPAVQVASLINIMANSSGSLQLIDDSALDAYIFTRESYLQWRNYLATDSDIGENYDSLADYADLFEEDEPQEEIIE